MRYLNKIILLNSASVKYAELQLDGNVHFAGNQGVGKSTLLRAILFFYNADKLKLGLLKDKKSFDEYYFPYSNSIIVYEVVKESGRFCIIARKTQGRVGFRFADVEYRREFFVGADNRVFDSWEQMRDAIPAGVVSSPLINRYEEYRDILYGNNKQFPTEMRRFALLDSAQYQNVPRTIQNVFLNSKLDADFIKQTIIRSMNVENVSIDLNEYSTHLKNFENQLNDIAKWSEKNSVGETVVHKLAGKITETHLVIQFLEREIEELIQQFNYASEDAVQNLPKVQDKLNKESERLKLMTGKEEKLYSVHLAEADEIKSKINVIDAKLGEIADRRDSYHQMNIDDMLARTDQRATILAELDRLLDEKQLLTAQFPEMAAKYDAELQQLQNQHVSFINQQLTEKNNLTKEWLKHKDTVTQQYNEILKDIRKTDNEQYQTAKSKLDEVEQCLVKLEIEEAQLQNKFPYEAEIMATEQDVKELNDTIASMQAFKAQAEERTDMLMKQSNVEINQLEDSIRHKKDKLEQNIRELTDRIGQLDRILKTGDRSLYEWLNREYPEWPATIGKIADIERVLFNTDLKPVQTESTERTLFGIKIDLSKIGGKVKTIKDYTVEKEKLLARVDSLRQQMNQLTAKLTLESEKIKHRHTTALKKLKDQNLTNNYLEKQASLKLENSMVKLEELKSKSIKEKKNALKLIQNEIKHLTNEQMKISESMEAIQLQTIKKIETAEKDKDKRLLKDYKTYLNSLSTIDENLRSKERDVQTRQAEISFFQKKEFSTKGLDTRRIMTIEKQIAKIRKELEYIDDNYTVAVEYRKDHRELFQNEEVLTAERENMRQRLQNAQNRHYLQKSKLRKEREVLTESVSALKKELELLNTDLKKLEVFRLTPVFRQIERIDGKIKTDARCVDLIEQINQNYYTNIRRLGELKENIRRFLGNFSENNIFKFNTHLVEDADFLKFAEQLKNFMEEDRVAYYQAKVNQLYADIIRQIGRETAELVSQSGKIAEITKKINADFIKRIFTGVIKCIELRIVSSENRIVQMMMSIMEFNNEHSVELGVTNLFSPSNREDLNYRSVELLKALVKEISLNKDSFITLSDSFDLQFRIVENDNDSGWVEKLSNVGSDGTDVLVKAMINIMLLNVFKENASKKSGDFKLHCMMDEIGKLHPTNIKGILEFANSRNIMLINSSPVSFNAADYKYTYLLSKDDKNVTVVRKLVSKIE
jgi:DNA repair exonuclease SbcCD ATPase subunit